MEDVTLINAEILGFKKPENTEEAITEAAAAMARALYAGIEKTIELNNKTMAAGEIVHFAVFSMTAISRLSGSICEALVSEFQYPVELRMIIKSIFEESFLQMHEKFKKFELKDDVNEKS